MNDNSRRFQLAKTATAYLKRRGFSDIHQMAASNGDTIIIANADDLGWQTVLVEVMDASTVKSVPLSNLGSSKAAKAKFARLKALVADPGKRSVRLDALWIDDGAKGGTASISHIIGLK